MSLIRLSRTSCGTLTAWKPLSASTENPCATSSDWPARFCIQPVPSSVVSWSKVPGRVSMTMSEPRTPQTADCVLIWYRSFPEAFPATVRTFPTVRAKTSCPPVSLRSWLSVKLVFCETLMIVPVWVILSSARSPLPVIMVHPTFSSSPNCGVGTDAPVSSLMSNIPLLFSKYSRVTEMAGGFAFAGADCAACAKSTVGSTRRAARAIAAENRILIASSAS